MPFGGALGAEVLRIIVECNPEIRKGLFNNRVVHINDLLWGNPFLFRLHGNGNTMFITATYK